MRIVQTFWSLPALLNKAQNEYGKNAGGFGDEYYHAVSWALSVLKFRQMYQEVELYTDEAGKAWLIDTLQLPYTKVHVCLDRFNNTNPLLWALPKIYTYSLQDKPFIHADGDVYVWKKFDEEFLKADLLVQNYERDYPFYPAIIENIKAHLSYIPPVIAGNVYEGVKTNAVNAGIIGGNNLSFFKLYFELVTEFLNKNESSLHKINPGSLNVIYEQVFFYNLAKTLCLDVVPLFDYDQPNFRFCTAFDFVPHLKSYIHLIGTRKSEAGMQKQIVNRLHFEFPDHYSTINDIYRQRAPSVLIPDHSPVTPHLWDRKKEDWKMAFKQTVFLIEYLDSQHQAEPVFEDFKNQVLNYIGSGQPEQRSVLVLSDIYKLESAIYELATIFPDSKEVADYFYKSQRDYYQIVYSHSYAEIKERCVTLDQNLVRILDLNYYYPYNFQNEYILDLLNNDVSNADLDNRFYFRVYNDGNNDIFFKPANGWEKCLSYFVNSEIKVSDFLICYGSGNVNIDDNAQAFNGFEFVSNQLCYTSNLIFEKSSDII